MQFKTYWQKLTPKERTAFAARIGTSEGYCRQLAYGDKRLELGLADSIVAAAQPDIALKDLPLTDRAKFQANARQWDGKTERRSRPCSGPKAGSN